VRSVPWHQHFDPAAPAAPAAPEPHAAPAVPEPPAESHDTRPAIVWSDDSDGHP
jgi:hypothetical protein